MADVLVENDDRPVFYYCYLTIVPQPDYPGDHQAILRHFLEFLQTNSRVRPEHSYRQPYMDCLVINNYLHQHHQIDDDCWCRRYSYCERFYDFANSRIEHVPQFNCYGIKCTWDSNCACIKKRRPFDFINQLSRCFKPLVFILDMAHDQRPEQSGQYYICDGRQTFRAASYCLLGDHVIDQQHLCVPIQTLQRLPKAARGPAFLRWLVGDDGAKLLTYSPAIKFKSV